MGAIAAIVGAIGGICAAMGIVTAAEVIPITLGDQYTWMFWFVLAAVLLLASIALALGRSRGVD